MSTSATTWLACSACKNPIRLGQAHYVCSVSTCNRARTRLVFCTVSCWDSHVAMLRHREAWAVDARAPSEAQWQAELASTPAPVVETQEAVAAPRRVIAAPAAGVASTPIAGGPALTDADRDILVVVSKLKKYVKDRSGMNCSDAIAEGLSDHVRAICDEAIRTAAADNRKTVLDRDIPKLRNRLAILMVVLLLGAAPRLTHADAGGTDYTAEVRALFRVGACGSDDAVPARFSAPMVAQHCKEMQRRYGAYKKAWADRARTFITALQPANLPTTVVYPFGGGDLGSALTVFPAATDITTLSLEAVGDIRVIDTIAKGKLSSDLSRIGHDIQRLYQSAFSSTNHLQEASHSTLPGTVMFALAALALHGFEPVSFRYFTLGTGGSIHYLTEAELATRVASFDAQAIAKKKYKRDPHNGAWHEQESPFSNMEITYRPRGDGKAALRTYRHLVANLDNAHLGADDRVLDFLRSKGKVASMTKAASFLLWYDDFSMVRDYLLVNMTWMVTDASGIRPTHAAAAGFTQTTYGEFVGPLFNKDAEGFKSDMIKLWRAQPHRPLPFRFGYPDAEKHSHLMITQKPGG